MNPILKDIAKPHGLGYTIKRIVFKHLSEEKFLQAVSSLRLGYDVDLKHPKTFNEKLNWLKLHDRRPLYHDLVDKYEVKRIVAEKIGQEYVVPCYGVWNSFKEIDFESLPTRFVIKSTHYGIPMVVKDKSTLDIEAAQVYFDDQFKTSGYETSREWVYKDIKPRILVDKYLDDHSDNNVLQDYKFWCFNGEPRYMYLTVKDKYVYENFYDMEFSPVSINHGFPRRSPEFDRPRDFELMKELAKKLSKGIPFVRIDFFYVDQQIYFGEFTFYDWGGEHAFESYEQDLALGNLIVLPKD